MVKIEKVVLADGKTVRWRARGVSVGKGPDGKRTQRTITGPTKKAVEAEVRRIGHEVDKGTYVRPWDGTVDELLDAWFRTATRGKEANTRVSYRDALRIPRERLGKRRALSVNRDDIEALVDFAMTEGRKRGGKPGSGLGVRSARLMLGRLSAAFEMGIDDRKLPFNPCRKVRISGQRTPGDRWSADETRRFLAVADADRLAAAWRLSLYGLRREESCGLRWDDVDLQARTVTIGRARVLVDGEVIVKVPKSERGYRTLPLDDVLTAALQALHDRQVTEEMEAGEAYQASGYVVADELGAEPSPEWYTDEFHRVRSAAGVRRITLLDVRRTANSLMADAGVPDHIRAAWCGHTVAVNVGVYTRAQQADMAVAGAALSKVLQSGVSKV